jgi:hypothetical protein
MIKKFGLAVLSCLSAGAAADAQEQARAPQGPILVQTNSGADLDVGSLSGNTSLTLRSEPTDLRTGDFVESSLDQSFRLPLRFGNDFSVNNFSSNVQDAARFKALDLSTPMPLRQMRGDTWSAEVTFGASSARTGLGFDVQATPRAQIQRNTAGGNVARVGGEVRIGQNLADRDLRGTGAATPAWYFFIGADNEALVWNMGDKQAVNGVTLQDAVTTGDIQVGVAWRAAFGGQMSLGVVERELEFNDIAGDHDVRRKDHFVAFSYTLRR